MRYLVMFLFIAVISAASFVYNVKYRTSKLAHEAASLEEQIGAEQRSITTLRAEWSAVNQPARLQALAERHLPEFKNAGIQQMAFAYELPERGPDLGKFITTLDAQPGLETPIDKKIIPAAKAIAAKPVTAPSVRQASLPSIPVVRAPSKAKIAPKAAAPMPSGLSIPSLY